MKKRLAIEAGSSVAALLFGVAFCGGFAEEASSPPTQPVPSERTRPAQPDPSGQIQQPPRQLRIDKDIVYVDGSSDDKHRLDVYMPAGGQLAPTIVFIHGGYWVEGDKAYDPEPTGLYHSLGVALARQGVGVVVPSYRLAPGANIDAMLDDVMGALRWTYDNIERHHGDPSRIVLMGHSAGGQLVALMCSDASLHGSRSLKFSRVSGCIALSAVFDIVDMHARHDADFNEAITYATFGRAAERHRRFSPITHFGANTRPLLILIGERDFDYMIPQARAARDKLKASGNAVAFQQVTGNDHMDMVRRFGGEADNMTEPVVRFVRSVTSAGK
jgi:acetyl esterase/lipase